MVQILHDHNQSVATADIKKDIERKQKAIDNGKKTLTEWDKLLEKKHQTITATEQTINNESLWPIMEPESFTKGERQCLLRICAPDCGVLSKTEHDHISVFVKNNVTIAKVMSDVEKLRNKINCFQKEVEEFNSLSDALISSDVSVDQSDNEDKDQFSESENEM